MVAAGETRWVENSLWGQMGVSSRSVNLGQSLNLPEHRFPPLSKG